MCGIVIAFTPGAPTRADTLSAMTRALRHRGPDDEGYLLVHDEGTQLLGGADTPQAAMETPTPWRPAGRIEEVGARTATLSMGHRRLSIVDLSPWGHQPMRHGRDLFAVYNGEIYNHPELREELEALGHRFDSHSDTEVLLAAYAQWGPQALSRLNGMWALAIYDARRRTLFVARDRFGVKPLYLWQGAGGALLLASEIKALLVHPAVRTAAAAGACVDFVQSGPRAWQAQTEFEGIVRFPAGHWAELALDDPRPLQPQAFWSLPAQDAAQEARPFEPERARRLGERYAELLEDAVRLRMRADVRIGTALSGGLDSSSIALLVNTQLRRQGVSERQEVFSSVYDDPRHGDLDESRFIERVAQQLDVRSNRIVPQAPDVPAAHERMIWALDTPPANTLMSSWHTFRLVASRSVVVTLDGQGADEQLAGYSRYARNLLTHLPWGAAWRESRALRQVMGGMRSHVALGLAGQVLRRAVGNAGLAGLARALRMGSQPAETVSGALAGDFLGNLKNLLLYADKTAMAWSVESRMPFMDYRLVAFLAEVEPAYKIHDGWTKWLGRSAFAGRLPDEVVWRRDKMGWPIPEREWFGGPLKGWLDERLQASDFAREIAHRAGPRRLAAVGQAGALAMRLRLLNLATWHRLFFEEAGRPGRALGHAMLGEVGVGP